MSDQAPAAGTQTSPRSYRSFITDDPGWVKKVQELRWAVFSAEYGERFSSATPGLDADKYDPFCQHVVVWDEDSGSVVGTYRILGPDGARRAGSRFAEQHFDLSGLASADPAALAELGRSCVHPGHRNGAVISGMWAEIGQYAAQAGIRWLGGCLSIPLTDGGQLAARTWNAVSKRHLSPEQYRVRPLIPWLGDDVDLSGPRLPVPPLLLGYLRAGAWVCGEPAHDVGFPCVDFFVLLDLARANARYLHRYQRHQVAQEA
jgi:putative hemolysin